MSPTPTSSWQIRSENRSPTESGDDQLSSDFRQSTHKSNIPAFGKPDETTVYTELNKCIGAENWAENR